MLLSLVKNTEWEQIFSLLSPTFFEVVPARMLFGELRGLTKRYVGSTYRETCAQRAEALQAARLPFTLVSTLPKSDTRPMDVARGHDVLTLYFHQVLGDAPVLLDMRSTAFERAGDRWLWKPAPAISAWTNDFREGVRALYEGFYLDDTTRFSAGAQALGLGAAEAELRAQFGDTRAVTFSLRDFQARFHAVFERCKATGSTIHPGFLTLGLGLATLYEHLEGVGAPLDVRAAFDAVVTRERRT